MQVGGKIEDFASNAFKVLVDIDRLEIDKFKSIGFKFDLAINLDIKQVIENLKLERFNNPEWSNWLSKIKSSFTLISEHAQSAPEVNSYQFIDILSNSLPEGSTIITDAGGNLCWTMQGFKIKDKQRLVSSWNHSPMGFSLPAAIGASFAKPNETINCIIGDGGLMMCLQELGTVARHNLPINIYIFNNRGHGIQKQTIDTWLNGNHIGVDHASGLFFPNFKLLAESFGIRYRKIETLSDVERTIEPNTTSPIIYDVMIDPDQKIYPMLKFGGDLTNLDDSILKPVYS